MTSIEVLPGMCFGHLTVLRESDVRYRRERQYDCICVCGKRITVRKCNLTSGNTKSCGCMKSKHANKTRELNGFIHKDLSSRKFGRLTVLKKASYRHRTNPVWICRCECGNQTAVIQENLLNGHTKSCGCLSKDTASRNNSTHRESHSRLYGVWRSMKARCQNPKIGQYKNYGGRGISVCEEWQQYEQFRDWALSHGYDPNAPFGKCTIDRIDNDGDYEPSNCRWVDFKTQAQNKRRKTA